ncbi:MAG: hypothetical protein G8237_00595 [Magnetococcales bacterium]|nr:hypothetical protein [Magnetococcales bacterium]NGZ04838.1 hypothetical protein [Magnetococcales bacterium]
MKTVLDDMLAAIARHSHDEQERILTQARQEAAALIANAHQQARQRMRTWVANERRLLKQTLQNIHAQEETEQRNHTMQRINRHLEEARLLLDRALLERWHNPPQRQLWIEALVMRALQILPPGEWEICLPPDLVTDAGMEPLTQRIMTAGLPAPRLRPDARIMAGIRLGCQGVWLDGSVAGLLANRPAIDAALLALMHNQGGSVV